MCRIAFVNPCRADKTAAGGALGGARQAHARRPQGSCLFLSLSFFGLVVFGFTTLVVASLESLVEPLSSKPARTLEAAPAAPSVAGPPLAIVDEPEERHSTASPSLIVTPAKAGAAQEASGQDDFERSLGAVVAKMLSTTRSPTSSPTTLEAVLGGDGEASPGEGAGDDDGLPEPPQPGPDDDEGDVVVPAIAGGEGAAVSNGIAKGLHTCKYGRSEKTGGLSMSTWIWRFKKSALSHDDYAKTPGSYRMSKLRSALKLAWAGEWKKVPTTAALAGFTLCKVDLGAQTVIAWQPRVRGDVLLFTRHGYNVSNVVIEVPHPQFDHTLVQSLHVFQETRGRALMLSTSHRCSKALANKCTGNDGEAIRSNCASRTSYHNSDAAHATQTMFMMAHEELAEALPQDLFVSLHSTKLEMFVISDGTSREAKSESQRVVVFARRLASLLPEAKVGLCNPFAPLFPSNLVHVPKEETFVCGATNVQGRHLNGAKDPCKAVVSRSGAELQPSHRFVHVEQPVGLVKPESSKSLKPPMSKPLSLAILSIAASG